MWGTDLPTYKILLNGAVVFVRPNLWFFLHYARDKLSENYLWVDNLCINQADQQEKNIQVALMGRLYTKAALVRSWLNGQRSVFTAAERCVSGTSLLAAAIREPASLDLNICNLPEVLLAMARLVTNEYWSRAWIVQELLLAKEVLLAWEGQEISWRNLKDLFEHVFWSSADRFTFKSQISAYLHTTFGQSFDELAFSGLLNYVQANNLNFKEPLIEVMLIFQYQQASDFHDRAFAFLGLADVSGRSPLKIDYNDSADELWCRLVYAAAKPPGDSDMARLAQLIGANSRPILSKSFPGICHLCIGLCYYSNEAQSTTAAIPGSPWIIGFGSSHERGDEVIPVCAVPWQEEDPAPVHVVHRDNMRHVRDNCYVNCSWRKRSDFPDPSVSVEGSPAMVTNWTRSPTHDSEECPQLFTLNCDRKHSSDPFNCCQHSLDVAIPVNTEQTFLNTLPTSESTCYGVVDMGHWHDYDLHDEAEAAKTNSVLRGYHIFLLVWRGGSISDVASEIISYLARTLDNSLNRNSGQNGVWLADCPRSRSSRNDVLKLIEMCRQECRDIGEDIDIEHWEEIENGRIL